MALMRIHQDWGLGLEFYGDVEVENNVDGVEAEICDLDEEAGGCEDWR
jgi:hypothetical protein